MHRNVVFVITALLAAALGGCGGGQRANTTGEYRGPNQLDFELTRPVRRAMPPERHDGSAEVIDTGGTYVTLELRIFGEGETPCRVQAQRSSAEPGRFDIVRGQRCASRFRYDGRPVAALTQIDQGVAYHERGRLRIAMQGPFVADVLMNGRVVPTEGFAVWRFEGWR